MEFDPHVLLLLAVGGTEKIVSANPPAHKTVDNFGDSHHSLPVLVTSHIGRVDANLRTESTRQIMPGITDNHIDRTVLDAIASISVSESSGQAVAVALEMDVAKQVAVLTIAVNSGDMPSLVAYLNGLWRLLSIMSTRWETLREVVDPTLISSLPPTENVEPWRTEFIKRIYRHCIANNHALFVRESVGLQNFETRARVYKDIHDRKLIDTVYSLHLTRIFLSHVVNGHHLTDEEWGNVICLMDGTVLDIEDLLETGSCEEWATKIQLRSQYNSPYPLRSTLETLITQHRHIRNLLRFAHSPGSRPALLSKMTIRAIPRHSRVLDVIPSSKVCWQALIESVCGEKIITNYTWLDQQATKLFVGSSARSHYSLTVHGPCALIAHLETAPSTSQPPFSYIGASSEICRACHTWIQAFNAVGNHHYCTRETSGNWCHLWAMPELKSVSERAQVAAKMARLLTATYVDFWTAKGHLVSVGDIPNSASGSGDSTPTPNPVERRQALLKREILRVSRYGW